MAREMISNYDDFNSSTSETKSFFLIQILEWAKSVSFLIVSRVYWYTENML